jgi:ferric-dicitrate binding protein FerR (iron transport regulator)
MHQAEDDCRKQRPAVAGWGILTRRFSIGSETPSVTTKGMLGNNGKLEVSQFDLALADWRSGEFHYTETPLAVVFEELERQFNVVVQAPDLANRFYTGRFNTKDLNEALQLVCLPMGLQFEANETTIVVSEKEINER